MTGTDWRPFELAAGWPSGTTVLEASAGTGKTWTIAALATRWIADGLGDLDDLLLVTFGRSASLELRERVRVQLAEAHRWLSGHPDEDPSQLERLLMTGGPDERRRRRDRLAAALAGFDAATIATTHTFCSRMLAGLGIAGDHDPRARLLDDLSELRAQVIGDTYLQRYSGLSRPMVTRDDAQRLALDVLARPGSRLEPAGESAHGLDAELIAFAGQVSDTMRRRKRLGAVMDYDDLQLLLRDALADPVSGPLAARVLRRRYRVVMVDEFQDTDPVQWQILQLAFHGHRDLVLIGDPKQAIYAFRGGDVFTYLQATRAATHRFTLTTNWRADGPLVAGVQSLLDDLALGDARIVVRPVTAARDGGRLLGAGPAVRIRQVTASALGATGRRLPTVGVTRPFLYADLAADVARLLTSGATLTGPDGEPRPVRPGDVAVLVDRNDWGGPIRRELARLGVPAVDTATRSVFATDAAGHWRTLLEALDAPHRPALARAALLTPFVGWTAQRLAAAVDADDAGGPGGDAARSAADDLDDATSRLGEWAGLLRERGVAAAVEAIGVATDLPARLLAQAGGERLLTDLRHVGELLHAVARDEELGLAGLIGWLRSRTEESARDQSAERARRLESDAHAVQITTVHRAKGLEYPVVYLPGASDRYASDTPYPLHLHDAAGDRVIDLSKRPGEDARDRHHEEEAGEDLRKLYVGLTRASSQVVTWWVPSTNVKPSALHRVLFAARRLGGELAQSAQLPDEDEVTTRLRGLAAASGGTVGVELVTAAPVAAPVQAPAPSPGLTARSFTRTLDNGWRRTSYSGLTADAHAQPTRSAAAASEPDDYAVQDEPDDRPDLDVPPVLPRAAGHDPVEIAARGLESPMQHLPGGTTLGTVVHEVLERFQPGGTDPAAALRQACERVLARRGGGLTPAGLAEALLPSLLTPLAGLPGAPALAHIAERDLLREADFELPMAGGDMAGRAGPSLADLADLMADLLEPDDRLAGYPARLRELAGAGTGPPTELRGYLTGSIDAVARLHAASGPSYVVIDYKTNRLGQGPLTAWDYRPTALDEAMADAHYPLQALLYSVALHRFLRWRQPDYDPGSHLGPIAYTFLRGMCGPRTPVIDGQACGVFCWRPPTRLVTALSDLLTGAVAGERHR